MWKSVGVVLWAAWAVPASGTSLVTCHALQEPPVPWQSSTFVRRGDTSWSVWAGNLYRYERGASRSESIEPGDEDAHGLWFQDARRGWVVGDSGSILRTTNKGRRWTRQAAPTEEGLVAITCLTPQRCWVLSAIGQVLTTTSAGKAWVVAGRLPDLSHAPKDARPPTAGMSFHSPRSGHAFHGNALFATADGGATWSRLNTPFGDEPVSAIAFANDHLGWTASGHRLAMTTDGGITWTPTLDVGGWLEIGGIAYARPKVWVPVGGECRSFAHSGSAYESDDDGRTWHELRKPWETARNWEAHVQGRGPVRPLTRVTAAEQADVREYRLSRVTATDEGLE